MPSGLSHQDYSSKPLLRNALMGAYAGSAALSAAVWARSLPEDVRSNPLPSPLGLLSRADDLLLLASCSPLLLPPLRLLMTWHL